MKQTHRRRNQSAGVLLRLKKQGGQAIVLLALTGTLLIGGVGIAVDLAVGYMYSIAAERAAAAAALSGVVFMPDQFAPATAVPVGSRNDATDRAVDEAKRNAFDPADAANAVRVTPAVVPGHPNQLRVTVARNAPVFFMQLFGFSTYQVARTAVAAYLPPISLGQPGSQIGSSLGDLGRTRFAFMREEGYATDRGQGDAYTPSQTGGSAGLSDDTHQISYANGSEPRYANLRDLGGYNYRITIPNGGSGGKVQVYNAAFSPDGTGGSANFCDNNNSVPAARTCSVGGNQWFHEDDGGPFDPNDATRYVAMRYTLFRVNNVFIRSSDQMISQMTVYPIDARNWSQAANQYKAMGGPTINQTVTQLYSGSAPSNMLIYHNWVDVATYQGASDNQLVSLQTFANPYLIGGVLQPGEYRLRVDALDNNGNVTNGRQTGHKGYAVKAVNPNFSTCATCAVSAWDDMAFFTPFDAGAGGSFSMDLFRLTPDYAGLTISVDIWDVGDIASTSGFVRINILDPSGNNVFPGGVNVYDLGPQRSNLARGAYTVWASAAGGNTTATFVAQDTSTGQTADNKWIHVEIPVPANYNPAPGADWWKMQYVTGAGTVAVDTVTVAVGLKGGPLHLLP
ncbi:MAG TPA: hypothetical protein VG413_02240 [Candidatus Dormibacteraeota bacterium]|jgi:hypothetical protein|nr:hypothetical protein [Candidatus Dormibacteraeota bacterium]